jgi:hypothetical protein
MREPRETVCGRGGGKRRQKRGADLSEKRGAHTQQGRRKPHDKEVQKELVEQEKLYQHPARLLYGDRPTGRIIALPGPLDRRSGGEKRVENERRM